TGERTVSLTEAQVRILIDTAVTEAKSKGKAFSIAVVDEAGYLLGLLRMEGAGFLTPQIAEAKAFTAAAWGKPGGMIAERARAKPELYQLFTDIGRTKLVPGLGSAPVMSGTRIVGALGVSGGSGDEDEAICKAALAGFSR